MAKRRRKRARALRGPSQSHFTSFDIHIKLFGDALRELRSATACILPTAVDVTQQFAALGACEAELNWAATGSWKDGIDPSETPTFQTRTQKLDELRKKLFDLQRNKIGSCQQEPKHQRASGFRGEADDHRSASRWAMRDLRAAVQKLAQTPPCTRLFAARAGEAQRHYGRAVVEHNSGPTGWGPGELDQAFQTLDGLMLRGICLRDPAKGK